ncbi:probable LRR receptor-like serine/threonine-protein kinase At1g14390 [Ricinus communis]|uniref:probable LRR receptor-like serine/threonine-protein kinase At1g14390 n=1 Tax=Ricinus communis TaxID=3988 RepID=UPI00201B180E|nr:probable LRR receptor-like serine/threonine-protein kinase At1g14390 [Ricinus communis]
MENLRISLCLLLSLLIPIILAPVSVGQLSPSETRILFQVQKLLEYPQVLQRWTNWTNFCWLPPSPSLKIVCSNGHVTELTVIGNRTSPSQIPKPINSNNFQVSRQTLSKSFSIDAFFTVLTKLSNLKVLSLVSLGLWGPFPAKINRLWSLEVLNVSSNFIYGAIPQQVVSLKNLSSLVLSDNLLKGPVPDLKSLALLQELDLGGNNLGPNFPSISKSVVTVILGNNSLRSIIPSEIKNFNQLQQLDISSNKLIGPVPSSLFSLPSIQFLDLAQNQLSGALPSNISCNFKLKFVDISNNLLIGKLPSCIASNSSNRTVISSWNCLSSGANSSSQHPLSFCHKEALAVKPPVETEEHKSTIQIGLILAIIGGVVGIAGALLLILIIIRRSKRRANGETFEGSMIDKISVVSSSVPTVDSRRVPQTMRSAVIGLPPYRVFTLEEIEDATNNFDPLNFMGEGSQGQLYKGWLRDGAVVLVKCVKLKQKNLPQSLVQHMEVLSKLRHLHLVSVLGHCIVTYQDHPRTATTVFVVLEHVSNGSLSDYLTDRRKKDILKWPQRMSITVGVARGIQFLHTGVAPGIFGNNIKIENVLLDESLTAKLSNYTIPMPSKVGSESPLNGQDTYNSSVNAEKEDVYQLGVILLQMITGKLVTSPNELEELKIQVEKGLAEAPTKLRAIVDPSTRGTFAYESLRTAVKITMNCLSKESSNRPSIEDVLWNLQYSMQVQEGWASSGNLATQM